MSEGNDGSRPSAELHGSRHAEHVSTERTVIEQFCRMSNLHVNTNTPTTPTTTIFIKSSENSCCGSVTIKSEQREPDSALCASHTALRDLDYVERQQQLPWNREMAFETPSCDSVFTFNDQSEACCALDVRLPPAYNSSCHSEAGLPSTASSLGTVLTPSELPLPVRCLLTPPDSVDSVPDSPPPVEEEETPMSGEEVDYRAAVSPVDTPSSTPAPDQQRGGLLVLTPVTRRPRRTHPGTTTIKYNRRNNPDLDRRRVHFCDFPGKS